MQPVWIAVSILFAVGFTALVCVAGGAAWYFTVQLRKLQQVISSSAQTLMEFSGDTTFAIVAKSLRQVAGELPEAIESIKTFNSSMSAFTKAIFVEQPTRKPAVESGEGEFIAYDEGRAAQAEVNRRHKEQKLELSEEQLAGMRTDKKEPAPTAAIDSVLQKVLAQKPTDAEESLTGTPT